jgi:hypothetical protein
MDSLITLVLFTWESIVTEAFGLNMVFNYRSLTIMMDTNFELPLVKGTTW